MSSEAKITVKVEINNGNQVYRNPIQSFSADMTGRVGPAPAGFTATTNGVDVDLSQFVVPTLCVITNQEPAGGNLLTFGIYEPDTAKFYPVGEVWPGESYALRLATNLRGEFAGTGTLVSDVNNTLRVKAQNGPVSCRVDVFER